MLCLNIFSLWVISLHVIVCLTPVSLLALARYHTLKARAATNVINWKARKQYNAALSKSKANKSHHSTGTTSSKIRKPRNVPLIEEHGIPVDLIPADIYFRGNNSLSPDLLDDSFLLNEMIPEKGLYDEPVIQFIDENGPNQSLEAYDQLVQSFPENANVEYQMKTEHHDPKISEPPSRIDLNSQQKNAEPTFNSFHSHQHGFIHSHIHGHSVRPIHEFNEFPNRPVTNVIQNQQTIISPSNQHRPHHGTFGGGGIHQNAGNRFQTRPDQFQQHIPNNHLSIHQNQAVSQNFLRSQHNEEGVDSRYNFMSAAEFDQPDDNELVSTFELKGLKDLDANSQYGLSYPETYNYSPLDFDPKKPENKQPLVKFIEDKEKEIKTLVDNMKASDMHLLEYDKQQKKYLLHYLKKQHENIEDFKIKHNKHLMDLKKDKISSLIDKKKDRLHTPKEHKKEYDKNYNLYSKPNDLIPLPLPSDLPNYEIKNEPSKHENINPENPYDSGIFPYAQNENGNANIDSGYPGGSYDLNPQYIDPFNSWTSPNYLIRDAEDLKREETPDDFVMQEMSPLEKIPYPINNFDDNIDPQVSEHLGLDSKGARRSSQNDEEDLMKLLTNHPNIDERTGLKHEVSYGPENNPRLEYIFQVPSRYYDNYRRESRSTNQNDMSPDDIANILKTHKEKLNSLKTDNDENLLLLQSIGNGLITEIEGKLNSIRVKRQGSQQENLWKRLLTDPNVRLDMPQTLDNMGTATKNTFEDENAPMYNVRNIAGSVKDTVMATMKIPNQNFIVPSKYDIINRPKDDVIGDINPSFHVKNDHNHMVGETQTLEDPATFETTFNKVGSVIKSTVKSGQEALSHIADIGNHAKNTVYRARQATPRLVKRKRPHKPDETIFITPKIAHIIEENRVGSVKGSRYPDFIKFGHLMDAVGASNPNNNLEIQQILLRPRKSRPPKSPNLLGSRLGDVLVGSSINRRKNDILGETLNTLREVREAFGVNTLREFFMHLRRMLQTVLNRDVMIQNVPRGKERKIKLLSRSGAMAPSESLPNPASSTEPAKVVASSKEIVGDQMFLPEELLHPFMKQPTESQIHDFFSSHSTTGNDTIASVKTSPIVGAINPRMLERFQIQSEDSIRTSNNSEYTIINTEKNPTGNDNDTVSTVMKLQGRVLKPFLGQLKNKKQLIFKPHNQQPNNINNENGKYIQTSDFPIFTYDELNVNDEPPTPDEGYASSYEENI